MENVRFKGVKLYSSTEWMYKEEKVCQKVFLQSSIDYIYTEAKFENLKFSLWGRESLVEIIYYWLKEDGSFDKIVHKSYTIKFRTKGEYAVREGWGNEALGSYWSVGNYKSVVLFEGEKIAEEFFSVSQGWPKEEDNPYFDLLSVKVFEADVDISEKRYLTELKASDIRYLFVELELVNRLKTDWKGEFKLIFLSETGETKGKISLVKTRVGIEWYKKVCLGWGNDTRGTWFPGELEYRVSFMNRLIFRSTIQLR